MPFKNKYKANTSSKNSHWVPCGCGTHNESDSAMASRGPVHKPKSQKDALGVSGVEALNPNKQSANNKSFSQNKKAPTQLFSASGQALQKNDTNKNVKVNILANQSGNSIILNIQDEQVDQLLKPTDVVKKSSVSPKNPESQNLSEENKALVDNQQEDVEVLIYSALVNLYLGLHVLIHGTGNQPGPGLYVLFPMPFKVIDRQQEFVIKSFQDTFKAWKNKAYSEIVKHYRHSLRHTIKRYQPFVYKKFVEAKFRPNFNEDMWYKEFEIRLGSNWNSWYTDFQSKKANTLLGFMEAQKDPDFNWEKWDQEVYYEEFKAQHPDLYSSFMETVKQPELDWKKAMLEEPFSMMALFFAKEQNQESTQLFINYINHFFIADKGKNFRLSIDYHELFLNTIMNRLLNHLFISPVVTDEMISGVKMIEDFVVGLQKKDVWKNLENLYGNDIHSLSKDLNILKGKLEHFFTYAKQATSRNNSLFFKEANAENVEEKQDSPEAPCAVNSASLNLSP